MKIAVIRKNGIGDFIAGAVPLCNYLKQRYSDAEFYFFVTDRNKDVPHLFFPSSKVFVFDKGNKYYSHCKMALKFKKENFDFGFSPVPNYPKLNSIFLWLLGAKHRYCSYDGFLSKMLLNHGSPVIGDMCAGGGQLVGLSSLQLIDKSFSTIPMEFYPIIDRTQINKYAPNNKGPYIMVEVSNRRDYDQLSSVKMANILNTLYKDRDFTVLITGKTQDEEKARKLTELLAMPSETFMTSEFKDFVGFIDAADIVLCGDGGVAHLAAACGKNVLTMFVGEMVYYWKPLGRKVEILYDDRNVNNISDKVLLDKLGKMYCSL